MARKNLFNDIKLFSIFCYLRERSTATQYVKYKCELEILTKSKLREEVKRFLGYKILNRDSRGSGSELFNLSLIRKFRK